MANKKKLATSVVAVATAATLLLGGTFAWQSISQTALNEASDVINPGGRLHDDFNGTNKDVYVENFADDDIYARVRLDEYFEITVGSGEPQVIAGQIDENGNKVGETHYFTDADKTKEYWTWATGGSTVYVPTFNKNKDSLQADINGTYNSIDDEGNRYADYEAYDLGDVVNGTEIYDADKNDEDEVGTDFANLETYEGEGAIKTVATSHEAVGTARADLISMQEWFNLGKPEGDYWVYDEDGWVYYAKPISSGEATGLLLDEIKLNQVMDDSWYYAINVTAQFITADDLGKEDGTGFYQDGQTVSGNALELLKAIGVEVKITNATELQDALEAGGEIKLADEIENTVANQDFEEFGDRDYNFLWTEGGTLEGGAVKSSNAYWGIFINSEDNWPVDGDVSNEAIIERTEFTSTNNNAAVYTQAIDAPITLNNVKVTADRVGIWDEYEGNVLTLNNCTVKSLNNADAEHPWLNTAVAVASNGNIVINSGTYTGENAVYVFSSGGTITINDGYFDGALKADEPQLIIKGGTFTADPTEFVDNTAYDVIENDDDTWTVKEIVVE